MKPGILGAGVVAQEKRPHIHDRREPTMTHTDHTSLTWTGAAA